MLRGMTLSNSSSRISANAAIIKPVLGSTPMNLPLGARIDTRSPLSVSSTTISNTSSSENPPQPAMRQPMVRSGRRARYCPLYLVRSAKRSPSPSSTSNESSSAEPSGAMAARRILLSSANSRPSARPIEMRVRPHSESVAPPAPPLALDHSMLSVNCQDRLPPYSMYYECTVVYTVCWQNTVVPANLLYHRLDYCQCTP